MASAIGLRLCTMPPVRLQKFLADAGVASRRAAEQLILAGQIRVDGQIVRELGTKVDPAHQEVSVDGMPVRARRKVYLALNKPRGLVTTRDDPQGRATIYECLEGGALPFVAPVGRLDKASEGLLLFTNDSKWAAKITDPNSRLEKRYHVQVDCIAGNDLLAQVRRGVEVAGERLRVKAARVLRVGGKNSWLEISLDEGKNRHIRRLLEGLGVQVLRLVRVSIGPLELGVLKKGEVRPLTDGEKRLIDQVLDSESRSAAEKNSRRAPRNVG